MRAKTPAFVHGTFIEYSHRPRMLADFVLRLCRVLESRGLAKDVGNVPRNCTHMEVSGEISGNLSRDVSGDASGDLQVDALGKVFRSARQRAAQTIDVLAHATRLGGG
jgi:hypothetical protein